MTDSSNASQMPMGQKSKWFWITYLLVPIVLTSHIIYTLWSPQPSITAGQVPVPKCVESAGTVLYSLYLERVRVGSTLSDFLITGCGFTVATQVKFNGTQHAAHFVDANRILAGLTSADVGAPGTIVVTLSSVALILGLEYWPLFRRKLSGAFWGLAPGQSV